MSSVSIGDLDQWSGDPFDSGIDANDMIFGRGAIDDKHSVFGILEALNYKAKTNERPKRTFYVAFGHDEETQGYDVRRPRTTLITNRDLFTLPSLTGCW